MTLWKRQLGTTGRSKMPMPRKPGYGVDRRIVKGPNGNNQTIYTRNCDFCGNRYEGRGKRFCGKSCATRWARENKDYSNARFPLGKRNPKGGNWTKERRNRNSVLMKARWASGLFTSSTFQKPETSLEKVGRLALEELGLEFKAKWWLNATGWKPKEYDFFVRDLNLLIEIDGTY